MGDKNDIKAVAELQFISNITNATYWVIFQLPSWQPYFLLSIFDQAIVSVRFCQI